MTANRTEVRRQEEIPCLALSSTLPKIFESRKSRRLNWDRAMFRSEFPLRRGIPTRLRSDGKGAESPKSLAELKEKGMVFSNISPDEMTKMKAKVKPVIEKYVKDIGVDLANQAQAEIQKAK
jgi:hypothetical protein